MTPIKRTAFIALLAACVFLSGCTSFKKDRAAFEAWRSEFLSAESREITALVTRSEPDGVCSYELLYTKSPEGETVQVLEDELLSGVTARLSEDGAELLFDGVVLETGTAISGALSPISALPEAMKALSEGFLQTLGYEKKDGEELIVTELLTPEDMTLTLWQKKSGMEPVFATLQSSETVDITISFTKIQ